MCPNIENIQINPETLNHQLDSHTVHFIFVVCLKKSWAGKAKKKMNIQIKIDVALFIEDVSLPTNSFG